MPIPSKSHSRYASSALRSTVASAVYSIHGFACASCSQGRTEREVAQILSVGNGTIHRDVAYLRKQAQDNLRFHVQERLPAQYLKCQNGLDQVLKMAWNMIIIDSINQSNKLQALSLISDCYKYQMDLSTNGIIVTDAIKYVNGKMEHLNNQEKKLLHDIKEDAG